MKTSTVIAIIYIFILGFIFGYYHRENIANDRLESIFQHWDSKTGGTKWIKGAESYNLKTFDSGKNWYAVQYDDDFGMKILGEAEDVYPGLLKHLNAMDDLTSHIKKNGAITLKGGIDSKEANLLRDVGFNVIEKK